MSYPIGDDMMDRRAAKKEIMRAMPQLGVAGLYDQVAELTLQLADSQQRLAELEAELKSSEIAGREDAEDRDRYRAALQTIRDYDKGMRFSQAFEEVQDIARRALGESEAD